MCTPLDISRQRATERSLYLTQQAVARSVDAVFFVRQAGTIHYVNQQAKHYLAIARVSLCKMSITDYLPAFSLQAGEALLKRVNSTGFLNRQTQYRRSRSDQSLYDWELRMSIPVYSEEEYFAATVREIAERKNSKLKRNHSNEEFQTNAIQVRLSSAALEKSNVDLQHFTYPASHDLQPPLRAIAGFARILKEILAG